MSDLTDYVREFNLNFSTKCLKEPNMFVKFFDVLEKINIWGVTTVLCFRCNDDVGFGYFRVTEY